MPSFLSSSIILYPDCNKDLLNAAQALAKFILSLIFYNPDISSVITSVLLLAFKFNATNEVPAAGPEDDRYS